MFHVYRAASKGRDKLDICVVQEIVVATRETRMGLLLDLEDDITSLDAGSLVTFTPELNLGTTLNTPVDVDVEDFPIHNRLLAVALLAPVLGVDLFTLAITIGADGLESLDHGSHLAHHGLRAVAITAGALLDCALLSAATLTLRADDRPLKSQLRDLAAVYILEGDLVGMMDSTGLGGSARLSTAEHAS